LNYWKGFKLVWDLAHQISPAMQTFPVHWHKAVTFETLGTLESVGRRTTHIHIGTHSGTHIDAPKHFIDCGLAISDMPTNLFFTVATVLDLSFLGDKSEVQIHHLESALDKRDLSETLILYYDWGRHYGSDKYYPDQSYLSEEAGRWIIERGVKLLGYDTAMPDNPLNGYGSLCDSPMHKIFLEKSIFLLENLRLPPNLPRKIELISIPLNLRELDGSPTRPMARKISE
jgi:kynurenine formamidase